MQNCQRLAASLAFALLLVAVPPRTAWAADPEGPKPVDLSQATAKDVFRDCPDCPQMVIVGAGSFTMGSPVTEPGHQGNEGAPRKLAMPRFAIGRHDVTRGQWALFAAATKRRTARGCDWSPAAAGSADASWEQPGFTQDDRHPVVCVNADDAQDYVKWLGRVTGRAYRLPTDAEWEYVARAGAATPFPWGDTATHELANYGTDACCSPRKQDDDQWLYTSPVGALPKNLFGAFDMQGNVQQWVMDCPNPAKDCGRYLLRGGSWSSPPAALRAAARDTTSASASRHEGRSGNVGLRVAASLP
jgi:formylglycine-generating enzyme required for sulfatase activity